MAAPREGDDDDYEDALAGTSLFVSEDYDAVVTVAGVALAASGAACTDHDLTGQVVWPAAGLLAAWLDTPPGRATLAAAGWTAIELGAGAGVVGAAAAAAAAASGAATRATLLLTDGSDVVLRLLAANAASIRAATGAAVAVSRLDWDAPADRTAAAAAAPGGGGWPLVLGADVAYSVKALPSLFATVAAVLAQGGNGAPSPTPAAVVGYVSRCGLIDRGLAAAAAGAGLTATEVPGTRRGVGGGLVGWVVRCERQRGAAREA